ncbi:MAG: PQQ-dependent sugar dehydrogenase [Rhodospirillales bacterium]|jgi:glucose/arabinose dehydrogenase|nr:PQQ-dependent sugar dehydrogenase [Rhodospirillales bacterium]MDP6644923.1 PQQ-dependent sugar dehydrogenase [Rhodospirillales bacterium]MDP6841365.1 PQQ-dependent sugar dehydrogenase [Rhodospirillales bacterium]
MKWIKAAGLALIVTGCAPPATASQHGIEALLKSIELPPGFKISLFARVPRARSMAIAPGGAVFVGSRGGAVHMVLDRDKDGIADRVARKTNRLRVPNGIAFQDGKLFIAEQHRISYWADTSATDAARPLVRLTPVFTGLPDKSWHGWRYAAFGPDRKLYVSIGAPCNVCRTQGLEGTIIRLGPGGKNIEVVASGVRNSVGFDWHPKTGDLFFTDNGADNMGDDVPPDELNHVTRVGQFFGFPFYGGGVARTSQTRGRQAPGNSVAPVIEFQAHTANLGIHFYRGAMFPVAYRNDAFVAQHGSWNRSSPVGYRIMRIRFDSAGKAIGKQVFAAGWLRDGDHWGRPVDIKMIDDGSLLVSDDFAGVIYRISYGGR